MSIFRSAKSALDFLRRVLSLFVRSAASMSDKSALVSGEVSDWVGDRRASSDSRSSISASASKIFWRAVDSSDSSLAIAAFFVTRRRSADSKLCRNVSSSETSSGLSDSVGDSLRPSIFPAVPQSLPIAQIAEFRVQPTVELVLYRCY